MNNTNSESTAVLLLPGIGNSGPQHWQSEWERLDASMHRVMQDEWDAPRCSDWIVRLNAAVAGHTLPVVLVTHSSSCALVAHWAQQASRESVARVKGALLVAPSDPTGPNYPIGATGFAPVPLNPFSFPTIVVGSDNDIYVSETQARAYATAWASQFVLLPSAGHINSESRLGTWPEGLALLAQLRE